MAKRSSSKTLEAPRKKQKVVESSSYGLRSKCNNGKTPETLQTKQKVSITTSYELRPKGIDKTP